MGVTPDTTETITINGADYVLLAKQSGYTVPKHGVLIHDVHESFKVDPLTNMQRAREWLKDHVK